MGTGSEAAGSKDDSTGDDDRIGDKADASSEPGDIDRSVDSDDCSDDDCSCGTDDILGSGPADAAKLLIGLNITFQLSSYCSVSM